MNYFKHNGIVFAYDDEQVAMGYGADMTPMTAEEIEAHENPTPTPEQIQQQTNDVARQYLASTDWYVIRMQENGTPIPQDILDARQAARDSVVEI